MTTFSFWSNCQVNTITTQPTVVVEEAMIEMYLAGVSVRRVEDITQALWGTRVSPGTVSNLNKDSYNAS